MAESLISTGKMRCRSVRTGSPESVLLKAHPDKKDYVIERWWERPDGTGEWRKEEETKSDNIEI
jgi:hypothetical protein